MLVRRAYIPDAQRPESFDAWPYTVPCVAELAGRGLTFTAPVTMLVGENGSGKSTLVEAIAEGFKLDSHGGRAGRKYVNDRPKTPLGEVIELETTPAGSRMLTGPRSRRKGFFLRAETAFGLLNAVSGKYGYWDEDTAEMSHGEGFLTVFGAMFRERGFYVMDEPEAALSFESCLKLVGLMHQLAGTGAQVVCATHSPILAATPGADIIEVGEHGTRRAKWDELDLVDHWRRYLTDPDLYLRHITG
ncbi:AAA family ATPase [Saccharopolyspora hirsuta]|uniref:ATP-binding cassette domain-containing protein n=1 Tax=Saccharopolyspora hirsuta TaxID=1837 RepID=A0A5M7BGF4_SACHI|nr:AAA family ATPase [Saccharopolyspora hirsuta]KAA5826511.1 ATP-binding cassette domain-containing protein [Saccharopolyspora hirsuta]